jgi:hypothetical protein
MLALVIEHRPAGKRPEDSVDREVGQGKDLVQPTLRGRHEGALSAVFEHHPRTGSGGRLRAAGIAGSRPDGGITTCRSDRLGDHRASRDRGTHGEGKALAPPPRATIQVP